MAERKGSTYDTTQQNGTYGNGSVALLGDTLAADAIADVVQLGVIPGSSVIHTLDMINAALGALTTIALGYRYLNPNDGADNLTAFLAATSTVPAARTSFAGAPITIADGDGVEIVATVGGGAATGQLDVVAEYVYIGQ